MKNRSLTAPKRQPGRPYLLSLTGLLLVLLVAFHSTGLQVSLAQEETVICAMEELSVSKPLTELAGEEYVRMDGQKTGFTGGLYPEGSNQRPAAHQAAGLTAASQIVPLDTTGKPDAANGRIVFISIGMSNTTHEWHAFELLVRRNPLVNPKIFLINGAQSGRTADRWVDPASPTWQELEMRLRARDLTPQQVQVAWIKQTTRGGGDFPAKAQDLQNDLEAIARNLIHHYPNIKIAYFSSRTRSYTYYRGLSPEPNAFETGFAVKWLVEKQINGDPTLNDNPAKGKVEAPYITWGPYLWINGSTPRADGRVWLDEDMALDCTHPTAAGTKKVAEMLLEFFLSDVTSVGWFSATGQAVTPGGVAIASPPPRTPIATSTSTLVPTPTTTLTMTPVVESSATLTASEISPTVSAPTPTIQLANEKSTSRPTELIWLIAAALVAFLLGMGVTWLRMRGKS